MALTPEQIEAFEERQREIEEMNNRAPEPETIREAAENAQVTPVQREEGIVTQVGEGLKYLMKGGPVKDGLNAAAAGINQLVPEDSPLKPATQAVDDFILSQEEIDENEIQQIQDRYNSTEPEQQLRGEAMANLLAIREGSQAGVLTPLTIAGRVSNQDTPWSYVPEVIKDKPMASAVFNVMEVLTPTLLVGAAGLVPSGGAAGAVALTAESALETAVQSETNDDLIAGRTIAANLGQISEYLNPGSGAALTRELIEGNTARSKYLTAVVGYFQNLGINLTANQILKVFTKNPPVPQEVQDAARVLGKDADKVNASVNRVTQPAYSPTSEPTDAMDIDSVVPVSTTYYHGTSKQAGKAIREGGFTPSNTGDNLMGSGVYFTADADYARFYGDEILSGQSDGLNVLDITDQNVADWAESVGIGRPADTWQTDEMGGMFGEETMEFFSNEQKQAIQNWAKENGYDGISFKPVDGDEGKSELVLFDPKKADQLIAPRQSINREALMTEALRKEGVGEDGLTSADRKYFTSYKRLSADESLENALKEATQTLRKLRNFPDDFSGVLRRADSFWNSNKDFIDTNIDVLANNFADEMTRPLNPEKYMGIEALTNPSVETYLREYAAVSEEGFIAAALIGEEMGVRLQKTARMALNLDENVTPIDFSNLIETLIEQQDVANQFLIPLRRGKRKWAIEGLAQGKKAIKRVKDADVQSAIRSKDPISYNAPSRRLEAIAKDETDPGRTLRELWDAYQAGDVEAGQTLKTYLNAIAYSDPGTAVAQVDNLSRIIKEQFTFNGSRNAVSNIYYGFMLSRIGTQVASASSNIARLVAEPVGAIAAGKPAYGFGQLVGGWAAISDGLINAGRAIAQNAPVNSGRKIDAEIYNLRLQRLQLKEKWKGYQRIADLEGIPQGQRLTAALWFNTQMAGLNQLTSVGNRFLMGQDEFTKVVAASQIATGRAFQEAAATDNWVDVKRLTDVHMRNIFRDGVKTGKIIDQDVIDATKNITFTADIPRNGNAVDNTFLALQDAANESGFWRFVSPFTRVSYDILEVTGRYEPTGFLRNFVPRYRDILNGKYGETAQIQLESQIAVGRLITFSGATMALMGLMDEEAFIVPYPNEAGNIRVPYGKLQPFASILSVTATLVNGLRDNVISQGQYDRFFEELMFSLGAASLDQTWTSGITQLAPLLTPKNFGMGTVKAASGITGGLANPGILRMVADWANPYETIQNYRGNAWETFWGNFRKRAYGGAGNPYQYDELGGGRIPKVTTIGDSDNYWAAVGASIFNETVFPGKVKPGKAKSDYRITMKGGVIPDEWGPEGSAEVRAVMDEVGFTHSDASSLEEYRGIALSPTQQSAVQKALGEQGDLLADLEDYFAEREFKDAWEFYMENRQYGQLGNQGDGTPADVERQRILSKIRSFYRKRKQEAAEEVLSQDPQFVEALNRLEGRPQDISTNPAGLQSLVAYSQGKVGIMDIDFSSLS